MIISRTPLRMSFVGGGSDIADYYRLTGGAVLSTAIDKYIYVTANRKFDNGIRIAYSKTEEVDSIAKVEHRLVRASMQHLGLNGGVEITTVADIPSKGTGLGSSSAFTVGLLHTLSAFQGRHATNETLAADSCHIEINVCGEPIGKQDQYASAYGGFNLIEFLPDGATKVSPVICRAQTLQGIQDHLMMFYTGITRSASSLLRNQTDSMRGSVQKQAVLKNMVGLAHQLRDEVQRNNLDAFGEILHENWILKKSLSDEISSGQIDDWYERAIQAGATGGKLLGAGAGGFLIFFAPPARHEAICHSLPDLRRIPFRFERFGSQIIFYQPT